MSARNPMPGLPGLFLDSLSPHLPYLMMGINIAVRAARYLPSCEAACRNQDHSPFSRMMIETFFLLGNHTFYGHHGIPGRAIT